MVKVNYLEEIEKISENVPAEVLQDVKNRCSDWLASGGSPYDPYIAQQLRYIKNFERKDDK